jgi:hypothetical protein
MSTFAICYFVIGAIVYIIFLTDKFLPEDNVPMGCALGFFIWPLGLIGYLIHRSEENKKNQK